MLELIQTGFDLGNGLSKLCLNYPGSKAGYASKIPNYSTKKAPKGRLTKKNIHSVPDTFPLIFNGVTRYYGIDTLSLSGKQEVDSDKYKPAYVKRMFQASILQWLKQHNINPDWLKDKRLNVVSGMPPERYQDRSTQNKAVKAFKLAFNDKKPQYIKTPENETIAYFTAFAGVTPETLSWRSTVHKMETGGFTLLVDLGFGTTDLCLLDPSVELPITTRSMNNGLMHSHRETDQNYPWLVELNTLRKTSDTETYVDVTKGKIRSAARQLDLAELVIFGGGMNLLDKETIADIKTYAPKVTFGDEFTNVRNFMRLAK